MRTTEALTGMEMLIEALTILKKYSKGTSHPTHCEHDVFYVFDGIVPDNVTEEDKARLEELGFFLREDEGVVPGFASFKFGSC